MAKTNFTKVESMLEEGLRKMAVEQLLDMTDSASAPKEKGSSPSETSSNSTRTKQESIRLQTLLALQRDLKFLDKMDQEPYELFGIAKKTVLKHLKNPLVLSDEEWKDIQEKQIKIKKFRKDFEKGAEGKNNEDLIQQQRVSQKTKRFNINNKWVPLS